MSGIANAFFNTQTDLFTSGINQYLDFKTIISLSKVNNHLNVLSKEANFLGRYLSIWEQDLNNKSPVFSQITQMANSLFKLEEKDHTYRCLKQIQDMFLTKSPFFVWHVPDHRDSILTEGYSINNNYIYDKLMGEVNQNQDPNFAIEEKVELHSFHANSVIKYKYWNLFTPKANDLIIKEVKNTYTFVPELFLSDDLFYESWLETYEDEHQEQDDLTQTPTLTDLYSTPPSRNPTLNPKVRKNLEFNIAEPVKSTDTPVKSTDTFVDDKGNMLIDYWMSSFQFTNHGYKVVDNDASVEETDLQTKHRRLLQFLLLHDVTLNEQVIEFAVDFCSERCVLMLLKAGLMPTPAAFETVLTSRSLNIATEFVKVITTQSKQFQSTQWKKTLSSCVVIPIELKRPEIIDLLMNYKITRTNLSLHKYAATKLTCNSFKNTLELLSPLASKRKLENGNNNRPLSPEEQRFDKTYKY